MKTALRLTAALAIPMVLSACSGGGSQLPGSFPGGPAIQMPSDFGQIPGAPAAPQVPPAGEAPIRLYGTVTLYGDSIMAGNGTAETPAMTLQRLRPNLTVTDRAVAGTSLAMLATGWAARERNSQIVVIENGVIDSWTGANLPNFLATLRALINDCRANRQIPVLTGYSYQEEGILTLSSLLSRNTFNAAVEALAAELEVPFANWGTVRFDGTGDLLDGVHPGKAYSDRLVERLASTLDGVLA